MAAVGAQTGEREAQEVRRAAGLLIAAAMAAAWPAALAAQGPEAEAADYKRYLRHPRPLAGLKDDEIAQFFTLISASAEIEAELSR